MDQKSSFNHNALKEDLIPTQNEPEDPENPEDSGSDVGSEEQDILEAKSLVKSPPRKGTRLNTVGITRIGRVMIIRFL
jgi:hypothetical protein